MKLFILKKFDPGFRRILEKYTSVSKKADLFFVIACRIFGKN